MPRRRPVYLSPGGDVLGLVERPIDETVGGKIWRWLNPDAEAAEYGAVGKEAPPPVEFGDVMQTVSERYQEVTAEAVDFGGKAAKVALLVGLIAAALYGAHLFVKIRR